MEKLHKWVTEFFLLEILSNFMVADEMANFLIPFLFVKFLFVVYFVLGIDLRIRKSSKQHLKICGSKIDDIQQEKLHWFGVKSA